MSKKTILLVFGGASAEHEVSIASARNVYDALNKDAYSVILCRISKTGKWQLVNTIDDPQDNQNYILPDLGQKRFMVLPGNRPLNVDVILPILHGTDGEDGGIQGLAQLLDIPIVGCGVLASAVCMDKEVSKRLLMQAGVPVANYAVHYDYQPAPQFDQLAQQLGLPLFIKPASQGSSVGVSKVTAEPQFTKALKDAHAYDQKVLIESALPGQEVECAILGNEHPKASALGAIKPGQEFYDYDDKYDPQSTAQLIIPAQLPPQVAQKVRDVAIKAYQVLGCRGLARVDFFVDGDAIYVNEVNTMPGFTNISMYPKLWQESGVGYSELLDTLIDLAQK